VFTLKKIKKLKKISKKISERIGTMVKLVLYINRAGESNTTSSNPSPNSLPEDNEPTELPSPSSPLATHNHNIPEITQLNNDINHNNTTYYLPPSIRYLEDQNVARRAFLNGAFVPQLYVAFKTFQILPEEKILIIFRDEVTRLEKRVDDPTVRDPQSIHLALFVRNTSDHARVIADKNSTLLDLICTPDIKVNLTWVYPKVLKRKYNKLSLCLHPVTDICSSGSSDEDDDTEDENDDDNPFWM
jgi:hypothetical protein